MSYAGAAAAVTVELGMGGVLSIGKGGDAEGDKISNIENITGGDGGDVLKGNELVNVIQGGKGNDTISGGDGADTLDGGAGIDTVSYENSPEQVVITLGAAGSETVGDGGLQRATRSRMSRTSSAPMLAMI